MILHLGNDLVVYEKDIIIIMDAGCSDARNNTEFWNSVAMAEDAPQGGEQAKSYVLVREGGGCVVYPSPISSQTLLKRVNLSDFG